MQTSRSFATRSHYWRGTGTTEIAINLHWKGELIEREARQRRPKLGVSITYSHEPVILGTGGGIVKLADFLTDGGSRDFFVVNGKLLVDADLHALRARHERTNAVATMLVKEVPDAHKWGAIETDRDGRVLRIIGKGKDPSAPPASLYASMFTGVHVLSPRLVDRLPTSGESDSIRQAYLPALEAGERIEGVLHAGYFHEHSTPARYLEGNLNALYGRARLRYAPGPFTGVDAQAQSWPRARARSPPVRTRGRRAQVAAGAVVGARRGRRRGRGGRRRRARSRARWSWPNAHVAQSTVTDAIVTERTAARGRIASANADRLAASDRRR